METLIIDPTDYTPEIIFNPSGNIFSIKGKSLPENSVDFYKPIFEWISNFSNNNPNKNIALDVDIEYMNSSSIKLLFYIFNTIDKHFKTNNNPETCINWFCPKGDELIAQKGKESKDILELPFHIKFKD